MMKKLLAMILCLVMVLALAACNNGTPNNGDNSNGGANGGTPAAPGPNGDHLRPPFGSGGKDPFGQIRLHRGHRHLQ